MKPLRAACAVVATLLIVLSMSVVCGRGPEASAQTSYRTANGGSLNWGFKQSFRNYITTGAARGGIEVGDGAGDDGRNFSFPPRENGTAVDSDSSGTVALQGSVHFYGHRSNDVWILDMTISDFKVRVDGSRAQIIADVVSREFKGMTYEDLGDYIVSSDIPIADVNLNSPASFRAGAIDLSGTSVISPGAVQAFGGFYEQGQQFDDTSGSLSVGDTSTAPSSGGTSGSGGGAKADCSAGALGVSATGGAQDGTLGLIQSVNDSIAMWNNLLVNSERLFCNLDTLQARLKPQTTSAPANSVAAGGSGIGGGTTVSNAGTAAQGGANGNTAAAGAARSVGGTGGVSGSGNPSGAATSGAAPAGAGGAAASGSAPAGGSSVCTAEGAVGVTQSQLTWGVKQSFQNYIRGSIAKGQRELNGVGFENQQFVFAGSNGSVTPSAQSGTILYPGSVHFTGHGGILNLRLSNIEITFNGNSGELIADVVSSDMEGSSRDYGRTVVGTLNFSSLNVAETQASGTAGVILSAAGSQAFAEFYQPGQRLDPLSFTAALGGAANCAASQGSGGSGSAVAGVSGGGMDAVAAGATSPTFGEATTSDSYGNGEGNQFRIRSTGEDTGGGLGLDTGTTLMLIVAAFIVAGGSMTRFTASNPTG
ncbi:HtaA domain-containing protein [Corynebacterium pacaense]|uniref:HtaA domain-containing protein n=1 Tax=Corynebacterium pacaense TaxID=1816684 RepID=UPI001FE758C0|nr:HtaA domain-containing protein [Corynebacterium pacaense]